MKVKSIFLQWHSGLAKKSNLVKMSIAGDEMSIDIYLDKVTLYSLIESLLKYKEVFDQEP